MRLRVIFKYQKFSLGVLLSTCLIFSQFQPGIAYKSASCIKKRVNHREIDRIIAVLKLILLERLEIYIQVCAKTGVNFDSLFPYSLSNIKLSAFILELIAWSFAIRRSCVLQLKAFDESVKRAQMVFIKDFHRGLFWPFQW